jgi:uncharacterized protein (TIRG00374 family)
MATAFHLYAKAIRWRIILAPLKSITMTTSLANISIGLMANNILPARIGELVRISSLSKTENIKGASLFSALVVEKLFDGYVLILFFIFSSYQVNLVSSVDIMPALRKASIGAFIIYTAVLLAIGIFMKYGTQERMDKIRSKRFNYILQKLSEFRSGLHIVKDFKRLFFIFLWSFIVWFFSAAVILATISMFLKLKPDAYSYAGPIESIFLNGAISFGLMLPSAPGYFGSFHWICSVIFSGFGFTKTFSNSFAVFIHGSQYIIISITGMLFFIRYHLNFRQLLDYKCDDKEIL